jgi:hypothetical protein
VPVALTRAIRFAPGAVLRFAPAIPAALLETLQAARPQAAEILATARSARIAVEALDERVCRLRIAQFQIELAPAPPPGGDYTLHIAWTDPATGSPRTLQHEGIAAMLGGKGDVFFARRLHGENRPLLKLVYEADGALLFAFPAGIAERLPAALRALLPAQLALGRLSAG